MPLVANEPLLADMRPLPVDDERLLAENEMPFLVTMPRIDGQQAMLAGDARDPPGAEPVSGPGRPLATLPDGHASCA